MHKRFFSALMSTVLIISFISCGEANQDKPEQDSSGVQSDQTETLLSKYTPFTLTTDMSALSEEDQEVIPLLIAAAKEMDPLFWMQAYGDKDKLMNQIDDADLKKYIEINYGPWDRLDGNEPFVPGVGEKPLGANYYPKDIKKSEIENGSEELKSLYTMVRRQDDGSLQAIPYSEFFDEGLKSASDKLLQAAAKTSHPEFKKYLTSRAEAFLSNEYYQSDLDWMDMKSNTLDLVIGPIETYEDQLMGAKAAFEAYVLVKDMEWSEKLSHYATLLPALQEGLPVPAEYKAEKPGRDAELNAYDVIYYAGDCNAGSKTIAINLPNDEKVQLKKGTRRLQLKNAMKAKFDKILVPISDVLIAPEQRKHITFDAFFSNTMFHEVAHGLGIKNTIDGKSTVREALKEQASALEEGKADILGLYMITKMAEMGEFPEERLMDNYVTFMAGIFRSSRFGASSAHGRANMLRFNYFLENDGFNYDAESGHYSVDFEGMQKVMNQLSELILTIQGDGDYDKITTLMDDMGGMSPDLQKALDRVNDKGIPVDVIFNQGLEYL